MTSSNNQQATIRTGPYASMFGNMLPPESSVSVVTKERSVNYFFLKHHLSPTFSELLGPPDLSSLSQALVQTHGEVS